MTRPLHQHFSKPRLAALAASATLLLLGGCVSVLPKTKPVQMYRFTFQPQTPDSAGVLPAADFGMAPKGIVMGTLGFPQDSAGDRVTTIENATVSYVAGARWTAPAQTLFSEAVSEGFARSARTVRLEPRGPSAAGYRLDITVRRFESVYARGKPTVTIDVDARILRLRDKAVVGDRFITSAISVSRSDMSRMADAYNTATTEVVSNLIGFAQETMAAQEGVPTPSVETPSNGKQAVEGL